MYFQLTDRALAGPNMFGRMHFCSRCTRFWCTIDVMNKISALLMIIFTLLMVSFGTWQLFRGNIEAAFSTFPFLLIVYLFVKPHRQ
jgi:hypothetical protein